MLLNLFSTASDMDTQLVVRAVRGLEDPDFFAESSISLSWDLLEATSQ